MEMKFYRCNHCGQIITMMNPTGVPVICCGEPMQELVPQAVDASKEKHVPVWQINGNMVTVSVGSQPHPMSAEHYIQWIALQTDKGVQIRYLKPTDQPTAAFALAKDEHAESVYAYCNLHQLWKA